MIKIYFSKEAQKFLRKLNSTDQEKISKAIDKVKTNPLAGEKLKGEYKSLLKIYAWPYLVIYGFDNKKRNIFVVTIGHRQGIYKN